MVNIINQKSVLLSSGFLTMVRDHRESADTWKCISKIHITWLVMKSQIPISSYLYTTIKIQFKQPLPKFWLSVASVYPSLSQKAVKKSENHCTKCHYSVQILDMILIKYFQ